MEALNRRQFVRLGSLAGLSVFGLGVAARAGLAVTPVGIDSQTGDKTMRTVTDMFGREVEIPVAEEITTYGANAYADIILLAMLGVTEKLTAGYEMDIPENSKILYPGCDSYEDIACSSDGSFNIEEAVSLGLDFLFLRVTSTDDERLKPLEDAGIKVLCVMPGGMDEIGEYLLFMGEVFGDACTERANVLIAYQDACLADLKASEGVVTEKPRTLILWGMGDGTYRLQPNTQEVVMVAKMAGADMCFDEEEYSEVSMEQVLAYDADVIINWRDNVERESLESIEAFTSCRAYQEGNFYSVPFTVAGQAPSTFPFTDVESYYLMSVLQGDAYQGPSIREALENNALNFFDYHCSEEELDAMENGEVIDLDASHKLGDGIQGDAASSAKDAA